MVTINVTSDVGQLVEGMTLDEKCAMVVGQGPWIVNGCERLGVPEWTVSDGPVGVRGRALGPGLVVPGPSALAATWDVELVEKVGEALGQECLDRKVDLLLAPTVNLHRSPRGGRHFECYSEDPELSSRTAVAYIEGVQSRGVGACVKHFVANDQEHERHTIDVEVDERTMREIYLPPFEAAVTQAGVRSVMAAYNYVNGHHACAHPDYLVGILKDEWAFEGLVVSDWGALKDTELPARHGLDLEMPGPGAFWGHGRLRAAVEAGSVDEGLLDDKVRRILGFLEWRGHLDGASDHEERSEERPAHRQLARQAAAASMVLVKNESELLPLAPDRSIALIGPGAARTALLGGGSASLTAHRRTSVLDALRQRLGPASVRHALGVDMRRAPTAIPEEWISSDIAVELFEGVGFDGALVATETRGAPFNVWMGDSWPDGIETLSARERFTLTPPETGRYWMAGVGFALARLYVDGELITDTANENFSAGLGMQAATAFVDLDGGRDYEIVLEHRPRGEGQWVCLIDVRAELAPQAAESRLDEAADVAAAADTAVVVVGSTSEWETEGSDRASIDLPNGQDELIRRVQAANPRTVVVLNCGAPMRMPWLDDIDAVLLAWYPGQEGGEAIADVLLGDAEPGGRMPTSWPRDERDTPAYLHYPGEAGTVRYGEGIYVGYRWYDARGTEPLLPFGHGGSYTSFEWGEPQVSGVGPDVAVEVPVTNTGARAGSEVVQIYVAPHDPAVHRPPKELAGFAKVQVEPGATTTAHVRLRDRSFARWDPATRDWVVDPGRYSLLVAASAADVRHETTVELP